MDIRVLFVDDEPHILNALRRGLAFEEYECFFAASAEEALKIMEQQQIAVIVTDMRMPGMDGLALLKIVKEKYPDVVKIVLSGYAQLQQILATINQIDVFKFITKPWKMEEEFKGIIQQAIDYYVILVERKALKEELERKNAAYKNMMNKLDVIARGAQRESKHLRALTELVFASLHSQIEETGSKVEFAEFFVFVRDAYQEYLTTYQFEATEVMLAEFWYEIAERFKAMPQAAGADVVNKLSGSCRLKLSAGSMNFAVGLLQKAFFESQDKFYAKFILEEKVHVGTNKILECSLVFSHMKETTKEKDVFYQRRLDFLSEFLTLVLKEAEIGFVVNKLNQNVAAKFQLKTKDV
ncbi:MAG: response regulator [Pelosinus sp.]|nr:response regulator [Pelosinus sp.]